MKFTLLVPVWNEIEGMRTIMPRVKYWWVDQILIMDGGSTDGTIEFARERGYDVYVQIKPGFRQGYTEALPYIKGDVIITFTPDGNCIPELIPKIVAKMREGYDLLIVSRYLDGAKSEDDDLFTAFGNWMFTRLMNLLFAGHYTDVMGIYRAYKKQVIYDLELDKDEGYRFAEDLLRTRISWEPLLSIRAAKRKLNITEIPGDEPPRVGGKRKLKIFKWGTAYFLQVVREFFTP